MALVIKDRVKETTTTTGTGTLTLAGAVTGFDSFADVGDSNTTYYPVRMARTLRLALAHTLCPAQPCHETQFLKAAAQRLQQM